MVSLLLVVCSFFFVCKRHEFQKILHEFRAKLESPDSRQGFFFWCSGRMASYNSKTLLKDIHSVQGFCLSEFIVTEKDTNFAIN